jgi:hypothetical protein
MSITRRDLLKSTTAGLVGSVVAARSGAPHAAANLKLELTFGGFGVLVVDRETGVAPADPPRAAARSNEVHLIAMANVDYPRHYTTLRVLKRYLEPHPTHPEEFVEWNLRDYELSIIGTINPAGTTGVAVATAAALPTCPANEDEWGNVNLLGNLGRNGGGHGRVDPRCLTMDPPGAVAARAIVTTGAVRALKPVSNYQHRQWTMAFPNATGLGMGAILQGTKTGVIAENTLATMDVQSSVSVLLKPFKHAPGAEKLIGLLCPTGESVVKVSVMNHPSDDRQLSGLEAEPVRHFASYFDVLVADDRPRGLRPIPYPAVGCVGTSISGMSGFCPGAMAFTA